MMGEYLARESLWLPKWGIGTLIVACVVFATWPPILAERPKSVSPEMAEFTARLEELKKRGFASASKFLLRSIADSTLKLQVRQYAATELGDMALGRSQADTKIVIGNLSELAMVLGQTRGGRGISSRLYRETWRLRLQLLELREARQALLQQALEGAEPDTPLTVQRWAARQLCNLGIVEAQTQVERFLLENSSKSSGARSIAFCRLQIKLVQEGGSLLGGFKAALSRPNSPYGHLHSWAIRGLEEDASEPAQRALIDFARRLQDADWSAALHAQHSLKQLGWSDEDLHAVGVHTTPPWIRNPPHPPYKGGKDEDSEKPKH